MNIEIITKNKVYRLLRETVSEWSKDGVLRLSAALAYYSVFSIAPLLIIAVTMAGWAFGQEAVEGHLAGQLEGYIGPQAAEAVQTMVKSASDPDDTLLGGIIGGVTLILGASGIFGQLKAALNIIWDVKAKEGGGVMGFIMSYVLSFSMVLVIGFLLLTSLLLTVALAAASEYMGHMFTVPPAVWGAAGFLVSFGIVTLLFAFIFKVLPDAHIGWSHVWVGAVITAFLFELGKFGLSFYLGRESTASSFGAAGSVVLLLMWVYYASCILLFGAEFTQVYARSVGHVAGPTDEAVRTGGEKTEDSKIAAEPRSEHKRPEAVAAAGPADVWRPGSGRTDSEGALPLANQSRGVRSGSLPVVPLLGMVAVSFVIGRFLKRDH